MLWLSLYFPQLPIDRQPRTDEDEPRAVVLAEGPRRRILACNSCAQAMGVRPEMALKNAYALVPNLAISDYSEDQQQAHLEQLTLWALQYSSQVVPQSSNTLLIEIAASLKLFGGLQSLLKGIGAQLREQQVTVMPGIAPTPSAANLFARAGYRKPVRTLQHLQHSLANVSVAHLPLDDFSFKGLRQSGIRTIGELQGIAPAALTRRFGNACTSLLYKLDGRLPDPLTPYKVADTFSQTVDLPLETQDTGALNFPLKRLLGSLGGFLKSHDLGVRQFAIHLHHHRHKPHVLTIGFLDATADVKHLLKIAIEKLSAEVLTAPVIRLNVTSMELAPLTHSARDLFHKSHSQGQTVEQLMDQLMARLGKEAVYTALTEDDHRPEKASASVLHNSHPVTHPWPARPLWLLKEPLALNENVTLRTLPERIENGWWDDTDVRRDYFIASNACGSYYWLYRLRHQPEQWWIHGLFA